MALPRLTSAFLNAAFVIIALPIIVLAFAPEEQKGLQLGLLVGLSVVLTIVILLSTATASDSLPGLRIRRKPFVLAGHLLVLFGSLAFLIGSSYLILIVGTLFMVAARSAIDATHLPLLREIIPQEIRGRYSAPVSLMLVFGAAGGAVVAGWLAQEAERAGNNISFLAPLSLAALGMAAFTGLVFATLVNEPEREAQPSALLKLLKNHKGKRERAYYRFMAARTVYLIGIFIVLIFFVYLVKDVYLATDYMLMAGVYYAVASLGAAAFAFPAGRLADRFGCLPVIIGCGAVQVISASTMFFLGYLHAALATAGALLFGAAFGGMYAAALALSTKLIPRVDDTAKYMSMIVVSTYIAQMTASLAGGPTLDLFNSWDSGLGYTALFVFALLCFLGGGAVFQKLTEPSELER